MSTALAVCAAAIGVERAPSAYVSVIVSPVTLKASERVPHSNENVLASIVSVADDVPPPFFVPTMSQVPTMLVTFSSPQSRPAVVGVGAGGVGPPLLVLPLGLVAPGAGPLLVVEDVPLVDEEEPHAPTRAARAKEARRFMVAIR